MTQLRLVRVLFDPHSPAAGQLLADPQRVHRFTMSALPSYNPEARDGHHMLWRIDYRDGIPALTVQTTEPLADFSAWKNNDGVAHVQVIDDLMPTLTRKVQHGAHLRFQVRTNPTRWQGSRGQQPNAKRIPIVDEQQQIEWLARQLDGAFTLASDPFTGLPDVMAEPEPAVRIPSRHVHLATVTFRGVIEVTDPAASLNLIVNGLGRGKAFGLGMVQVV